MPVELIAQRTIGRKKLVKKAEKPNEKDRYVRDDVNAFRRFTVDTEDEAKALVASGAARRVASEEKSEAGQEGDPGDPGGASVSTKSRKAKAK